MAKKDLGGRPEISEAIVQKLEEAFMLGCTITEACLFADISRSTYYALCERRKGFSDRCEDLRSRPMLNARTNIVKAIKEGDVSASKWYAERKAKDEFSLRSEQDISANVGFQFIVEKDDDKI